MTDLIKRINIINLLMSVIDIDDLIDKMLLMPQVEMKVEQILAGGIYIRQITIPKDTFAVGKIHKYDTCDIVLEGSMLLYNGFGIEPSKIDAPMVFETLAGKQKVGYSLKKTVWMNCFAAKSKNIEEIEKDLYIERNSK
jgi:hypothetical protein